MAAALQQPIDKIKRLLDEIVAEFSKPEHGLTVREVAGGYKMATKAEHHEAVRAFVKKLTPPLKLSLPALETPPAPLSPGPPRYHGNNTHAIRQQSAANRSG